MKKILAVLLVLPLLSYLGFKAYMHYKVSDFLDKTLAPLSSSVQLKYGWVSSSLSGSAGVTGVRLYVKDTGDEVLVDSIKLDAGSLEELMKLSSNKRNADFPRQLTIQVKGMVVDFSSEYYQFLESTMDEYASADAPGLACGEINLNGLSHLRELGYQNTKIDATMRYKVNENATVTIALNVKVDGIQDIISTVNYDIGEFLSNPIVNFRRSFPPMFVLSIIRILKNCWITASKNLVKTVTLLRRNLRMRWSAVFGGLLALIRSQYSQQLNAFKSNDLFRTPRN